MKQNVMCISVRRDITSVGVYETSIELGNTVTGIKVVLYEELKKFKMNDVVKRIIKISKSQKPSGCMIECIGSGIAVLDYLKIDEEFNTSIYKVLNHYGSARKSENIYKTSNYIDNNIITIGNTLIKVDLNKYEIQVDDQCKVTIKSSEHDDFFSNLTFFVGNIDPCIINSKKIRNRKLIEMNLQKVVEILIDELGDIDKSDYKAVNDIVRLIDKVNYIRGQY